MEAWPLNYLRVLCLTVVSTHPTHPFVIVYRCISGGTPFDSKYRCKLHPIQRLLAIHNEDQKCDQRDIRKRLLRKIGQYNRQAAQQDDKGRSSVTLPAFTSEGTLLADSRSGLNYCVFETQRISELHNICSAATENLNRVCFGSLLSLLNSCSHARVLGMICLVRCSRTTSPPSP